MFENLRFGMTGRQQPDDGADGDPHPANTRLPAHHSRIQRNAFQRFHKTTIAVFSTTLKPDISEIGQLLSDKRLTLLPAP